MLSSIKIKEGLITKVKISIDWLSLAVNIDFDTIELEIEPKEDTFNFKVENKTIKNSVLSEGLPEELDRDIPEHAHVSEGQEIISDYLKSIFNKIKIRFQKIKFKIRDNENRHMMMNVILSGVNLDSPEEEEGQIIDIYSKRLYFNNVSLYLENEEKTYDLVQIKDICLNFKKLEESNYSTFEIMANTDKISIHANASDIGHIYEFKDIFKNYVKSSSTPASSLNNNNNHYVQNKSQFFSFFEERSAEPSTNLEESIYYDCSNVSSVSSGSMNSSMIKALSQIDTVVSKILDPPPNENQMATSHKLLNIEYK